MSTATVIGQLYSLHLTYVFKFILFNFSLKFSLKKGLIGPALLCKWLD